MYRLHCFSQSGNSFKVAFFLRVLHQPWVPVFVDYMNGLTRDSAWREQTNEMGEAPVLDDGPRRLTQSGAILTYLARKHGACGGKDGDEQQEVLRWFMKSFGAAPPDPTIMVWLKGRADGAFAIAEKHLASRRFIVGDAPTIADFSMSAYLHYPPEESGYVFAESHPNIAAWLARLRQIDGWAPPYQVLPGERILPKW